MDYDDIVIGSGLSALGVVCGLPIGRRVLVVGGSKQGRSQYYGPSRAVPCAHLGFGGLGNYWHGVIPTGGRRNFANSDPADFEQLFQRFYPGVEVMDRLGKPFLFVPWRPIRSQTEWQRLEVERGDRLTLVHELVNRFAVNGSRVSVHTENGLYRCSRVWVCCGALHSPALLDRSLDSVVSRRTISDHVLCYLGQIDRAVNRDVLPTPVQRTRQGMWLEARYDETETGLCTLRPARFEFSRLDFGIEQRAVFGLPTGSAIAKILRGASPALVAEALYNRAGLFSSARVQSVYAQIVVADAHWLRDGDAPLEARLDVIKAATDAVRASSPVWPNLLPSRRPEMFIPVIHLHHSVDLNALHAAGPNTRASPVQVVDASVYEHIGPEHHSFKLMLAAFVRARTIS